MKAIKNLALRVLQATAPMEGIGEGRILKDFLTNQNVTCRIVKFHAGWKPAFFAALQHPPERFVHFTGHGEKDRLILGQLQTIVHASEFSKIQYGLSGRILTLSACCIGKQKLTLEELMKWSGACRIIAPRTEVLFSEAAMFHGIFYYRLFAGHFFDRILFSDSALDVCLKVDRAWKVACAATGHGKDFRLIKR